VALTDVGLMASPKFIL